MKLMRKRSALLLAPSLVAAVVVAVAVQGAAGAPSAMHVKVTGKDYASQLSVTPLPDIAGVLDRRGEIWGGRQEASDRRVAGLYRSTFDVWEYRDGRAHFADMTFSLSNATGVWRGTSRCGVLMAATSYGASRTGREPVVDFATSSFCTTRRRDRRARTCSTSTAGSSGRRLFRPRSLRLPTSTSR